MHLLLFSSCTCGNSVFWNEEMCFRSDQGHNSSAISVKHTLHTRSHYCIGHNSPANCVGSGPKLGLCESWWIMCSVFCSRVHNIYPDTAGNEQLEEQPFHFTHFSGLIFGHFRLDGWEHYVSLSPFALFSHHSFDVSPGPSDEYLLLTRIPRLSDWLEPSSPPHFSLCGREKLWPSLRKLHQGLIVAVFAILFIVFYWSECR